MLHLQKIICFGSLNVVISVVLFKYLNMMHDYFHIEINPYNFDRPNLEKTKSVSNVKQFSSSSLYPRPQVRRNISFVTGQKLRESKWFTYDEIRIFCSVVETGFIVQTKDEKLRIQWGIAVWTCGYEKSRNPEYVTVYFLVEHKGYYKVTSKKLLDFWQCGSVIKINNYDDKEETPNSEETIRNKIAYAQKHKLKWHNTEHFAYWCRYVQSKTDRIKQVSDEVKWYNTKVNIGLLLLKGKKKSSV